MTGGEALRARLTDDVLKDAYTRYAWALNRFDAQSLEWADCERLAAADMRNVLVAALAGRLPVDEGPQTVTRFEVIGNGRELVVNPCRIELSYQDGGRTLKVFVTRLAGKPNGNFTESPKDQP